MSPKKTRVEVPFSADDHWNNGSFFCFFLYTMDMGISEIPRGPLW
jgi:hypothetical protein